MHNTNLNTYTTRVLALLACLFGVFFSGVNALATENNNPYLKMSIEDLMQVPLSVASKKPQALSDTAAAVFVLTSDDIRRSGATSLPEVLRLVPGIDVERINGHEWAVSSRGFTSSFSNSLLVMIDGRSVFTPLFAGVYWDVQNIMLEDVDRIEVVRGSGGAVWGANAVNGVINIMTKSAADTQGGLIVTSVGDNKRENGAMAIRYGFKIGEHGSARFFAKGFSRQDDNPKANGPIGNWKDKRLGFRTDWETNTSTFMLDASAYHGEESTLMYAAAPYSATHTYQSAMSGSHLLGLWQRDGLSVQAYFDRTMRTRRTFAEHRDTMDLDLKYHAAIFHGHDLQWGVGYRTTSDTIVNTLALSLDPASRTDPLYSAFIQDELDLTNNLKLTLGLKVENNNYTGFESAPNIRLMWHINAKQQLWASVARAYRPPSRADTDLSQLFVNSPHFHLGLVANPHLETTDVSSYELGYRFQPQTNIALEITAYRNDYKRLTTNEELPFDTTTNFLAIKEANYLDAMSKGMELNVSWQIFEPWRLKTNYTWTRISARSTGGNDLTSARNTETGTPNHMWSIQSALTLTNQLTFDTQFYAIAESLAHKRQAYTRLDARLGWKPTDAIEFILAMQNVQNKRHHEYPDASGNFSEFGRSYYGQMHWAF